MKQYFWRTYEGDNIKKEEVIDSEEVIERLGKIVSDQQGFPDHAPEIPRFTVHEIGEWILDCTM